MGTQSGFYYLCEVGPGEHPELPVISRVQGTTDWLAPLIDRLRGASLAPGRLGRLPTPPSVRERVRGPRREQKDEEGPSMSRAARAACSVEELLTSLKGPVADKSLSQPLPTLHVFQGF
ncbi:uncharacterized protein LOC143819312 isoform X2 [Paroedura picta]|uniref:uncharacterized protein LOC143819312 isoform X2 n=1 Tax=Paroedura picta TaxID=143630 RepID=UPI0040568275